MGVADGLLKAGAMPERLSYVIRVPEQQHLLAPEGSALRDVGGTAKS